MNLVPIEAQNIPYANAKRNGSNYKALVEFQESGATCVEVKDYPHKNAETAANCLRTSIRRYRFRIRVVRRKDRVFLIKV